MFSASLSSKNMEIVQESRKKCFLLLPLVTARRAFSASWGTARSLDVVRVSRGHGWWSVLTNAPVNMTAEVCPLSASRPIASVCCCWLTSASCGSSSCRKKLLSLGSSVHYSWRTLGIRVGASHSKFKTKVEFSVLPEALLTAGWNVSTNGSKKKKKEVKSHLSPCKDNSTRTHSLA